jgi:hypothetical protein
MEGNIKRYKRPKESDQFHDAIRTIVTDIEDNITIDIMPLHHGMDRETGPIPWVVCIS